MKDLFLMGSPLFMGILTLLFLSMLAWTTYHLIGFYSSGQDNSKAFLRKLSYGKSIGLFAMITGILGQLIGLNLALSAIEKAGDISPGLVVSGIKVSMISTIYGICIYLLSLLLWFVVSNVLVKKETK